MPDPHQSTPPHSGPLPQSPAPAAAGPADPAPAQHQAPDRAPAPDPDPGAQLAPGSPTPPERGAQEDPGHAEVQQRPAPAASPDTAPGLVPPAPPLPPPTPADPPRTTGPGQASVPPPGAAERYEASADRSPADRSPAVESRPTVPAPTAGAAHQQPPATGIEAAATVPRQKDGTPRPRPGWAGPPTVAPTAVPDFLDHPDPAVAAEGAAVENLLRCWVREAGLRRPDGLAGTPLRIPLPASGAALVVPVRYWSPTGWHRFGPARLAAAPAAAPALDAVTLAALIAREGTGTHAATVAATAAGPCGVRGSADLVGRVADSVRRTAEFIADRRERPAAPSHIGVDRFLTAEQSLLLGHPLQPDPKSREGLSETEVRRYSPELHGSFPLHWFAVAPSVLATESAWTERGRPVSATALLGRLAPGLSLPDGAIPLPLHPWQARDLLQRPAVAALRDAGLLHDLGPYGAHWYPTSSVRTVHRPGAPAMLKLSLGLRITNSRRENLRKELHRGVEVHRLLRTGLAEQWQTAHPGFDIVRDPAWVAVDSPDGTPVPGLDALLRHNPFRSGDDAVCVAALTSPRPWPGRTTISSRLAEIVSALAAATGRTTSAVSAEWFLRYLDHVVLPVLAFDALAGIALEAHQQNTLVLLDPVGWPVGGRYRDNQGYYFRESHRTELEHRLPGIGSLSDTFVSDAVTDERFAYYLGINNVLGLIGAFGSQRLADERVLLAAFRRFLGKTSGLGPLPARLLDSPTLRCKANLLTRLGGLDELVGPVDTQSVYVTIANPLHD
ncbi:IucA/IucC family protein [Streptomyces sp. NPDC006463]|uniref:IucA/IucC family protein n=1 Tax=Streptomyces sp. NPDC006463 TaxID=3364746 RepID=UPI0036B015EE